MDFPKRHARRDLSLVTSGRVRPIAGGDQSATDANAAIAEVASSVAQLRSAVDELKASDNDPLAREKVEKVVADVLAAQRQADPAINKRHGYTPEEPADEEHLERVLGRNRKDRLAQIHQRSAERVAPLLGRSVDDVRAFQQRSDHLVLLHTMLSRADNPVDVRETAYYQEEFLPSVRAMDTATSGEGQEWVPRELSSSFIERVNLELRVAALFPSIIMPTQPYDLPAMPVSRQRSGSHAEQTADTGQTKFKVVTPGTRKVTLTAVKFAVETLVSKEAEEDTIIPILAWIESELVEYVAADIEDTVINGDTTGTHMDSDTTGTDPRKLWIGLRKGAIAAAAADFANADLTVAGLTANRGRMGKYGVKPDQLAHIVSINNYIDLLGDTNLLTMEKYGANATILTGELAKAGGVPVIVSEYQRADLNATGVYDGTTTNRSVATTVNRKAWLRGVRRQTTVQRLVELYAESDQDAVTVSTRQAFTSLYPGTEPTTARLYNTKT